MSHETWATAITPTQQDVLRRAEVFAREQLARDSSGHDWWHVARVCALTRSIGAAEGADAYVCELAAVLHDVADYKIAGDEETGLRTVREWLRANEAEGDTTERVMDIISTMSFAGGNRPPMTSLEGRVVQDADRLDAIGAIGIGRTFAFGGARGRPMRDPTSSPQNFQNEEQYRSATGSTINHFYEKLLLLKDRMNTRRGRELAEGRHQYMQQFLQQFYAEWEGER